MRRFFLFFLCWPVLSLSVPFEGTQFVISGPSPHSISVAKTIFKQGGNLTDMAVASALALAVTHPYYVSLGSGGFALVKMNSTIEALDFREVAPYKMSSDFFEKSGLSSRTGGASVGVPGFVAGLAELHKKYGRLSWSKLVQPAIFLAEKGFPISGQWISITQKSKNKFNVAGKNIFLKKNYKPNELFKQPQLAKALKLLQRKKDKALYHGPIGQDIVSAVKQKRGVMEEADLTKYKVRWLKPVSIAFRGYRIHSMPLPSSGGIILFQALKLIERQKLYEEKLYSVNELHLLAEIMARAFLPRSLMGDFQNGRLKTEEEKWLSNTNIENIYKTISLKKTRRLPPPKDSGETTHISLMDAKGNAIAMTLTLNGFYGSHVVSPIYGIVLNNQMDDFMTLTGRVNQFELTQGKNNSVQGGKRPLSSMTPTIVEKNQRAIMVLGGAGGPKIINAVLQTLYRHLIHKMDIEQAILAPRLHHQFLPRELFMENKRFSPDSTIELKTRGHKILFTDHIARIFAVGQKQKNGFLQSAHDNRGEGASGGL